MLKLYHLKNNKLQYWETWDADYKTAIIHWGTVWDRWEDKEVKDWIFLSYKKKIQNEIEEKRKQGYTEFDDKKMVLFEIVYKISESNTSANLDKLQRLVNHLDELLGWTGLGHVDGNSYWTGTMEVCCLVIDYNLAIQLIQNDLVNTDFDDYLSISRIEN